MTIIRDYLQLPPFNIINKGLAQGEFYYFENIEQYNKEDIKDNNDKILFIEKSDGTEEIPKNVIGIILNQDLIISYKHQSKTTRSSFLLCT